MDDATKAQIEARKAKLAADRQRLGAWPLNDQVGMLALKNHIEIEEDELRRVAELYAPKGPNGDRPV